MGEEEAAEGSSGIRRRGGSAAAAGGHYLAKCVVRGSAVLQAAWGHLRSPTSDDVIFGKETSIELVTVVDDGVVQSICEQTVFGTIKDLAILHRNEVDHANMQQAQGKDLLVVLSDSGKLSFLSFCCEMHRFFAVTHIQLSKPGNPRNELGRMLAVDPDGCFVAVSAYNDRFAMFSVSQSGGKEVVDEKFVYPPENGDVRGAGRSHFRGTIWSISFISTDKHAVIKEDSTPLLVVLMNRRGSVSNDLFLFGCNRKKHSLYLVSHYTDDGPLALNIIGVPHMSGFALLFRMGDVLLVDLKNPEVISFTHRINFTSFPMVEEHKYVKEYSRVVDVDDDGMSNVAACALLQLRDSAANMDKDDPMNIDVESSLVKLPMKRMCSWSWEPCSLSGPKLIFCLDSGELFILEIQSDGQVILVNISGCLYKTVPCGALLWVKSGLIVGLIEMGDGLVLKLEKGKLVYKNPIQNISPVLDLCIAEHHDEKQDQMFACCGRNPEGSLRIIRSGISVERLLKTSPIYQGITGIWTLKMREGDCYHSFLVLSFVEETRVLSVGLSFTDVSDVVGFQPDACTLACGLVSDGLLVQIHRDGVRLCVPTTFAHSGGVPLSGPICKSWCPDNLSISLGSVGRNLIIVATSSPCYLFILGIRLLSVYNYEIYEIQHFKLQHEVSCISIPRGEVHDGCNTSSCNMKSVRETALSDKYGFNRSFVIGTHKPSVEMLSFGGTGYRVVAAGDILVNNALGSPIGGCIPEDVRLVVVDHPYIISGLRNGMLLRFEWPSISSIVQPEINVERHSCHHHGTYSDLRDPTFGKNVEKRENCIAEVLQLIAIRRIGITPVVLVPVNDSVDSDIVILSDRPWFLHTARHSLAFTSISFQSATHVTPVCSSECPRGILFVADNCLHLVEMVPNKRLNSQKFPIQGTPRKVLYHNETKVWLVLRTGLHDPSCLSDICCVDPLSGRVLSQFKCSQGEVAKCMQLIKVGHEQVLVVGTSQTAGRTIMPSGEPESARGRLIVLSLENAQFSSEVSARLSYSSSSQSPKVASPLHGFATEQLSNSGLCSSPDEICCDGIVIEETGAGQLRSIFDISLQGPVLSVSSYLDRYLLASAGNTLNVFGFLNDSPRRLRKFAMAKTRFAITCLTTYFTRIAVGDCRDGILFFSYQEDSRKLEHLYSDPVQRLVADCALVDTNTAVVSDRRGTISILSSSNLAEGANSPERNLFLSCSFYTGETVMSIRKGSFLYKLPADDVMNWDGNGTIVESSYNSIVASTLLGSVLIIIPISSEEHRLLEAVQDKLSVHPLTAPILGNDHKEFRERGLLGAASTILDGDMLAQFLELTSMQQEALLASSGAHSEPSHISVNQVVHLLERFHYVLN